MRGVVADFEQIERIEDVETLGHDLLQEKIIGVDTEADSFYHYFDKTCLVQISTRRQIYLIDPISMGGPESLAPLGPVFASPEICKVFHAAEYDIYVLKRDCGFGFSGIFDTMISAQLLGYGAVGLAALAERHFGLKLPKDEQRSDWSARPLRDAQLNYAAADVAYLILLSERLEQELSTAKRISWAKEEFEAVKEREWPKRTFDQTGYLKIKGARKLDLKSLAVLRELYLMRDKRARELDRPPFKVLGNRTLLEIAQLQPKSNRSLSSICGITDLILRRLGRDIRDAIQRGEKLEHGPLPKNAAPNRRRKDRQTERRMAALKNWRSAKAKELKLDPGVLCPNSSLESIAYSNPRIQSELVDIDDLKPWLCKEFGEELIAILSLDQEKPRVS